eukprot:Skav206690  [mRNA]  locus=scaffold1764:102581:108228:+ [translate_table: standard]
MQGAKCQWTSPPPDAFLEAMAALSLKASAPTESPHASASASPVASQGDAPEASPEAKMQWGLDMSFHASQLTDKRTWEKLDVVSTERETYLPDTVFQQLFGMPKAIETHLVTADMRDESHEEVAGSLSMVGCLTGAAWYLSRRAHGELPAFCPDFLQHPLENYRSEKS